MNSVIALVALVVSVSAVGFALSVYALLTIGCEWSQMRRSMQRR